MLFYKKKPLQCPAWILSQQRSYDLQFRRMSVNTYFHGSKLNRPGSWRISLSSCFTTGEMSFESVSLMWYKQRAKKFDTEQVSIGLIEQSELYKGPRPDTKDEKREMMDIPYSSLQSTKISATLKVLVIILKIMGFWKKWILAMKINQKSVLDLLTGRL